MREYPTITAELQSWRLNENLMYATGIIHNTTEPDLFEDGLHYTFMNLMSIEHYKDHNLIKTMLGYYLVLYHRDAV